MFDTPDAPISPIPTIPITAAGPGSMRPKKRSAADVNAIHNPTRNRILFIEYRNMHLNINTLPQQSLPKQLPDRACPGVIICESR